jgi:trigger factor
MTNSSISLKVADLNLDCQLTELESNKKFEVVFSLKCPGQHFSKLVNEIAVKKYAPKTSLNGFRAGKVPLALVKSHNNQALMEDSLNGVISSAIDHIISDKKFNLMGETSVKNVDFSEEKGVALELVFRLAPEFALPDFTKLKVKVSEYKFEESDLEEALKGLASSKSNFLEAEKGAKAVEGDMLEIDFTGTIDGVKFDGGSAEGANLVIGSNTFIEGFEEQLKGLKAGDKKTLKVTFPKDYHAEEFASKKAEFEVFVHKIKKNTVVFDDEFAKKLGLETLEKLKEVLKAKLQNDFSRVAFSATKKDLLDQLDKEFNCEIPEFALEAEREFVNKQYNDKETQEKQDEIEKITRRRVKLAMLFSKAVTEFDIKVVEEDFKNAILDDASNYPGQEKEVINYFMKNPKAIDTLRGIITENKVIKKIIELSEKVTKEVSSEKLKNLPS